MAVQDDRREQELIDLFKLKKPEDAGRAGLDAVLELDGSAVPFELKSTTRGSVTTVRDFGRDHIKKWVMRHWLIGVYELDGVTLRYCLYGSPTMMAPWIQEKAEYIQPDFDIAELVPPLITMDILHAVVGEKGKYSVDDAKRLHKKQFTKEQYRDAMDVAGGYSPERMLEILRDRCRYLIARGSTLNNPHVPESFFLGWEQITEKHAERLRELVAQELSAIA
jgi:hypothetical protein